MAICAVGQHVGAGCLAQVWQMLQWVVGVPRCDIDMVLQQGCMKGATEPCFAFVCMRAQHQRVTAVYTAV